MLRVSQLPSLLEDLLHLLCESTTPYLPCATDGITDEQQAAAANADPAVVGIDEIEDVLLADDGYRGHIDLQRWIIQCAFAIFINTYFVSTF